MDCEQESEKNVGCASDQNSFQLKIWYSTDTIPKSGRNILLYIVP